MPTRTFTRAQLDDWNLPDAGIYGSPEILHREQTSARDWVSVHDVVFRAPDDGKAYCLVYEQGLTEDQEDTDPWSHEDEIEGTEVEERQVTVTRWLPID
ncbi:hypothetical protein ABZX85_23305 [Streptomyces sp. NPDC004539]|uniref:hypothetical protein n=1 Tax=Streptomyces sp. NPDC004539 TaxID=3154280 RepID=UPI0033B6E48A